MIKIGVICPSEIALRRFLPSLRKAEDEILFGGIAIASPEEWFGDITNISIDIISEQQNQELTKAQSFIDIVGGKIYKSYQAICETTDLDALYIPLPPALHYKWAKFALENGKHVFLEKPSTTCAKDTKKLVELASQKQLALHENYMFVYHNQLKALDDIVNCGEIGDVRLYRISFGFPMRLKNDFRYNKKLGGGALLDAGGYCMKYAAYLLGDSAKLVTAQSNYIDGYEVEMYGSATMKNDKGQIAQLAFGMDNDYKCEVEIWGSKGTITTNRILTAPTDFVPTCIIKKNQDCVERNLPSDDAFLKSIQNFIAFIKNHTLREDNYKQLVRQEMFIESFRKFSK